MANSNWARAIQFNSNIAQMNAVLLKKIMCNSSGIGKPLNETANK